MIHNLLLFALSAFAGIAKMNNFIIIAYISSYPFSNRCVLFCIYQYSEFSRGQSGVRLFGMLKKPQKKNASCIGLLSENMPSLSNSSIFYKTYILLKRGKYADE